MHHTISEAMRRILMAVMLALVGTATLAVVPGALTKASAAPTVSRDEVIARADYWFRASNGHVPGIAPFGRNLGNSAPEPGGDNRYRTDCSGVVQMAWKISPGRYTDSRNIQHSDVSTQIGFAELKPADVLATDGHVTMFHRWANSVRTAYYAYDFGGGGANMTRGRADGRMEYREYTLRIAGDVAYRGDDDRPYKAFKGLNVTDGGGQPAPPPPTDGPNPHLPWVVRGQSGPGVLCVQRGLNAVSGAGINARGNFGPITEQKVKDLQRFVKISVDGKVGPQTGGVLSYFYDLKMGSGAWARTGCYAHVPAR